MTKLIFRLAPVFLLFVQASSVAAQTGKLHGKITNQDSGEPLAGANITLSPSAGSRTTLGVSSSANGGYEVRGIPPGSYAFSVSFIGYQTFRDDNFVLDAGEVRKLDIELTPRVLELEHVVASAPRERIDRQGTKKLEATTSVTVLDTVQIQSRQAMTPTDHLIGLPGVDVAKTGVTQSQIAIRGFNDLFSGSLLLLVDNRIARLPSLRFNAYSFIPTSNADVERIEVVHGPASSLYGPNSANGVLHLVTKSPFGSEGTIADFGFGQRSTVTADFRHAGRLTTHLGYKITGSFIHGNDFESRDAFEDSLIARLIENELFYQQLGIPNPRPLDKDAERIGARDFVIDKLATTAGLEYRPGDDSSLILNGGFNLASNLEFTEVGAAAVKDWRYVYGQAKLIYKDLWMQAFVNRNDAGGTYLTRDGRDISDQSKLFSYQIQNTTSLGSRQIFTYGFDALWTRPETAGTVNGLNEDDDNINEIGFYLQSETDMLRQVKLVLGGRLDQNDRLSETFFSPRAGFVVTPNQDNRLRFAVSRGFSTPSAQNLFLDRLISPLIPGTRVSFSSFVPFQPFNVRARGVPETGLTFRRDSGGGIDGLYMHAVPLYAVPGQEGRLAPADATFMWDQIVDIITSLQGSGLDIAFNGLKAAPPPTFADVPSVLKVFNTTTGEFETVDPATVTDIKSLEATRTTTFEVGYKGILDQKLLFNADLYYSRIKNFIGPLLLETPNVFFDRFSLQDYLTNHADLVLGTAPGIIAFWMSQIPVGTIAANESAYPGDLMLTYRNFGDINLVGLDLDFTYLPDRNLTITGAYSFVNKDVFTNEDGVRDIALNAPKNKYSLAFQYRKQQSSFGWGLRYRHVQGYPVNSGVFVGKVNAFGVLDLNAGVDLPGRTGLRLTLTVQNLLNNKHREFVGAPEIGRLAHLQVKLFLDKYQD